MISSIIFGIVGAHLIYNLIQTYLDRKTYSIAILTGLFIDQKDIFEEIGETSFQTGELGFRISPREEMTDEEFQEFSAQIGEIMEEFLELIKDTMTPFLEKKNFIKHYLKRITFQNPIEIYPDNMKEYIIEYS